MKFCCLVLLLNPDKTHFLQFLTKNSHEIDLQISYENKRISKIHNIKFLRLIDNNLSWGFHIDETAYKLNKVYYVSRSVKLFISSEVLSIFSFFWSIQLYHTAQILGVLHPTEVIFKIQNKNNYNYYEFS